MLRMSCGVMCGGPSTDSTTSTSASKARSKLKPLLGETVGHHDQAAVALRLADQDERRACVASSIRWDSGTRV
jgi:hypothetical protein